MLVNLYRFMPHCFYTSVCRAGKDETYVKEREMVEYSRKRKENEANSSNILFDLQRRSVSAVTIIQLAFMEVKHC